MTVKIKCPEIWTYNCRGNFGGWVYENRVPLTYLDGKTYSHIHGELEIIIKGRKVPHLGPYSDQDICIGNWMLFLVRMLDTFETRNLQTYTIGAGEQGQPDYKFDKEGDTMYLSILKSTAGGYDDPYWQRISFSYTEFKSEFQKFKEYLLLEISKISPSLADFWNEKWSPL